MVLKNFSCYSLSIFLKSTDLGKEQNSSQELKLKLTRSVIVHVSEIVNEDKRRPQFLYLDTIGWKTTNRHRIEIWFVEHDKRYYILSERKKRAHWVQNILRNPKISFTVSNKNFDGYARVIEDKELELISNVSHLMNNKYGWSDGLIVELNPQ